MIVAAVALGLVLIFRATNIVNFAQGAMAMMTTYIAYSDLPPGDRLLGGLHRGPGRAACCSAAVTQVVLDPPGAEQVAAQRGHRHVRPPDLAGGNRRRHLGELDPDASRRRSPRSGPEARAAPQIAFSPFDVFIVVAVLVLMVDHAGAVPGHQPRSAHAGRRPSLPRRPGCSASGSAAAHPRLGAGGGGRGPGRAARRPDRVALAELHGRDPRVRLHGRGRRRARQPGRGAGRRARHRARRWPTWAATSAASLEPMAPSPSSSSSLMIRPEGLFARPAARRV